MFTNINVFVHNFHQWCLISACFRTDKNRKFSVYTWKLQFEKMKLICFFGLLTDVQAGDVGERDVFIKEPEYPSDCLLGYRQSEKFSAWFWHLLNISVSDWEKINKKVNKPDWLITYRGELHTLAIIISIGSKYGCKEINGINSACNLDLTRDFICNLFKGTLYACNIENRPKVTWLWFLDESREN